LTKNQPSVLCGVGYRQQGQQVPKDACDGHYNRPDTGGNGKSSRNILGEAVLCKNE